MHLDYLYTYGFYPDLVLIFNLHVTTRCKFCSLGMTHFLQVIYYYDYLASSPFLINVLRFCPGAVRGVSVHPVSNVYSVNYGF